MTETPSTGTERRCRTCGAVVYEGAEWCGMCFTPVDTEIETPDQVGRTTGEEDAPAPPSPDTDGPGSVATWPCPVCDGRNPIDLDECATCGTPFAAAMRQEKQRANVDPGAPFRRSLLFPGLGHRMVGRDLDGFARGVLFAMLLLATLMLALSGVRSGAVGLLLIVYASATGLVYLGSAIEARRLAEGGEELVSSRTLLWATVAILLMSVVMVSLVIGTASRR
jgi:hypothetical protein